MNYEETDRNSIGKFLPDFADGTRRSRERTG